MTEKCTILEKNIKSYESAVEKLTEMRIEDKKDYIAKNKIVEQYLA